MLIHRLRRVAKWIETQIDPDGADHDEETRAKIRARANTCWQCAARLDDLRQLAESREQAGVIHFGDPEGPMSEKEIAWWHPGYRWWSFKVYWRGVPERLSWWLAWKLPPRVALFAFVRVYGAWGELGPDYEPVYKSWERKQLASSSSKRDPHDAERFEHEAI